MWMLIAAALLLAGGVQPVAAAEAPTGSAQSPREKDEVDAEILRDLDVLVSPDFGALRAMARRLPLFERLRLLETLKLLDTAESSPDTPGVKGRRTPSSP